MKIATMVRSYLPVPRPADIVYAPIDLAMAICEGLTEKGHKVTYFGPRGSRPPAKLQHLNKDPLAKNFKEFQALMNDLLPIRHGLLSNYDYYFAREMFLRARKGEFDLLHFHHPESALVLAPLFPDVPVVYTIHDPITPWYRDMLKLHKSKNQFLVSISNSQRASAPHLPYIATVYDGLHIKDFDYSDKGGDYLLTAGRIVPEKGIAEAVQVARRSKHKLIIVGPVFPDSQDYFNKKIKPYLNEDIKYLGYLKREELAKYMQKAKAFLMPIKWEEPFGLTMIESMASGTPVIAFRRGSADEVVKDGVTGFVVDTLAEMVGAVSKIDSISRRACRQHIENKFSVFHMVEGYEAAYKKAIGKVLKNKDRR